MKKRGISNTTPRGLNHPETEADIAMSSRDVILQRIRENLGARSEEAPPPIPAVWPRTGAETGVLAQRFAEELAAVHGQAVLCPTWEAAREDFRRRIQEAGWREGLVADRPAAWQLACDHPEFTTLALPDQPIPKDLEPLPVSILEADCLLADTGSSVIACRTAGERLACYLPPACVVVAPADRLREHLPAAWDEIMTLARQADHRGEIVIVTGPSRTADIEKILILGVHGPKRLLVYVVGV